MHSLCTATFYHATGICWYGSAKIFILRCFSIKPLWLRGWENYWHENGWWRYVFMCLTRGHKHTLSGWDWQKESTVFYLSIWVHKVHYCEEFRCQHHFFDYNFTDKLSVRCSEVACWCVIPLATCTPSFVIFQSTSTPRAPQLTSVNSRLLLATARVGQRTSSLGGSVTITSPRADTWTHVDMKLNIQICPFITALQWFVLQNDFLYPFLLPPCVQPRQSNREHNVPAHRICESLGSFLFL